MTMLSLAKFNRQGLDNAVERGEGREIINILCNDQRRPLLSFLLKGRHLKKKSQNSASIQNILFFSAVVAAMV